MGRGVCTGQHLFGGLCHATSSRLIGVANVLAKLPCRRRDVLRYRNELQGSSDQGIPRLAAVGHFHDPLSPFSNDSVNAYRAFEASVELLIMLGMPVTVAGAMTYLSRRVVGINATVAENK